MRAVAFVIASVVKSVSVWKKIKQAAWDFSKKLWCTLNWEIWYTQFERHLNLIWTDIYAWLNILYDANILFKFGYFFILQHATLNFYDKSIYFLNFLSIKYNFKLEIKSKGAYTNIQNRTEWNLITACLISASIQVVSSSENCPSTP